MSYIFAITTSDSASDPIELPSACKYAFRSPRAHSLARAHPTYSSYTHSGAAWRCCESDGERERRSQTPWRNQRNKTFYIYSTVYRSYRSVVYIHDTNLGVCVWFVTMARTKWRHKFVKWNNSSWRISLHNSRGHRSGHTHASWVLKS